jgi:hypothetical protein
MKLRINKIASHDDKVVTRKSKKFSLSSSSNFFIPYFAKLIMSHFKTTSKRWKHALAIFMLKGVAGSKIVSAASKV